METPSRISHEQTAPSSSLSIHSQNQSLSIQPPHRGTTESVLSPPFLFHSNHTLEKPPNRRPSHEDMMSSDLHDPFEFQTIHNPESNSTKRRGIPLGVSQSPFASQFIHTPHT